MARPTVYKRGAMTPAQRQRRRRKRLKLEAKREENAVKHARGLSPRRLEQDFNQAADREAAEIVWHALYWQPPLTDSSLPPAATEFARQTAEYLAEHRGQITIDDIRAALEERFGPEPAPLLADAAD
jgi:hypothetical protein